MQSIIEKYNDIQKGILHDFSIRWDPENSESFKSDVKKIYGFEDEFHWNILLNAFYVIDDTELAKESYRKFDLQGPLRIKESGEFYLRLYGILNAIYLQCQAIINLVEIYKLPNKKEIQNHYKSLEIIKLRNKIGSHSSNYKSDSDSGIYRHDVYEIIRHDLTQNKIILLRNQKNRELYQLSEAIEEFDKYTQTVLSKALHKLLKRSIKNKTEYIKKLENVDFLKDGGILLGEIKIAFTEQNAKT